MRCCFIFLCRFEPIKYNMYSAVKHLRPGTVWTIIFFVASFAKTIILTPLMLGHWGETTFCFWAIILSARAVLLFLSDGLVRYIVNQYNILFHTDEQKAKQVLAAGLSFLILLSLVLCGMTALSLSVFPRLSVLIFDTDAGQSSVYALSVCLTAYLSAACVQNIQRMYAATKESRGLVAQNMIMEVLLISLELTLLGLLLVQGHGFTVVLLADSGVILLVALAYLLHLFIRYPLSGVMSKQSVADGVRQFVLASQLYASNFFEKLTSDGLVLLLSFFRFDKTAIALFATVRTISNTPLLAQNLLLNTYTPQLQKDFALRDEQGLHKLFKFVRLRLGLILLTGIVCCYPLYEPVFVYWTKGRIAYNKTFMMEMLLLTVFNLYGLSFTFVLKGLNLLPQLLQLMLFKTLLIFIALYASGQHIEGLGITLAGAEFTVSVLFLPWMLHSFWRKQQMPLGYFKSIPGLVPYLLSAFFLVFMLIYV